MSDPSVQRGDEWNALTSPWIDCLSVAAEASTRSPLALLEGASGVARLTASSPLDLFAAHRFLLTLLYWKADEAGGVERLRADLLAGAVPGSVLESLSAARDAFSLFDPDHPFLQDASVVRAKRSSPAYLFSEMSSGTNMAHFSHASDRDTRLCLPCATAGLGRLVLWTQAGGSGLTPAVHGAPPIMAMALGADLAQTLGLNLIPLGAVAGTPTWTGHFRPSNRKTDVPYLEAFTWNPRRVNLLGPAPSGRCTRCGHAGVPVVGPIVYEKNEGTKKEKGGKEEPFHWTDPAAFYVEGKPYVTVKSSSESRAANGTDLEDPPGRKGGKSSKKSKPRVCVCPTVVQANPCHRRWLVVIPCTKPGENKSYDHRSVQLADLTEASLRAALPQPHRGPPSLLSDRGLDGWHGEADAVTHRGTRAFVEAALAKLDAADWACLGRASLGSMDSHLAAFDVLTGVLWPLRGRVAGLPSRQAAWLTLKLMASVPDTLRRGVSSVDEAFRPWLDLPRRQLDAAPARRGGPVAASYPRSLPRGRELERILLQRLKVRSRTTPAVDWAGLCAFLDEHL